MPLSFRLFLLLIGSVQLSVASDPSSDDATRHLRDLKKQESGLKALQTNRAHDQTHLDQMRQDALDGTTKSVEDHTRQSNEVKELKSADEKVLTGQRQQEQDHEAYSTAVKNFGPDHANTVNAQETAKQSRAAMIPLRKDQKVRGKTVEAGRRVSRNNKSAVLMQKRAVGSATRYVADDDAQITRKEKKLDAAQKVVDEDDRNHSSAGSSTQH